MLYAEDLAVGQRFQFGSYVISEEEILRFAGQYDPVSIHTDKEAAAKWVRALIVEVFQRS